MERFRRPPRRSWYDHRKAQISTPPSLQQIWTGGLIGYTTRTALMPFATRLQSAPRDSQDEVINRHARVKLSVARPVNNR